MKELILKLIAVVSLGLICNGCIESFDFQNETFENALVIEATLTNEMKQQLIILSRTYLFEADGPSPEMNADVNVVDSNGVTHSFVEAEPGQYVSTFLFSAQPNIDYQLKITTSAGRNYVSNITQLTQITQIDQLYAERLTNDAGVNGMALLVDSYDPTGNSKYYRYEYEETYKIIPPAFVPEDLVVINSEFPFCEVLVVPRSYDKALCYRTDISKGINIASTNALVEDRLSRHQARFISSDNFIITHRYSILVKQYVQTREAHTYFKALLEFSEEGSIFSQNQPGFVSGNIVSESDASEKVVGFFEVSSVTSERIFFNYDDFYPGEPNPPFAISCNRVAPLRLSNVAPKCGPLIPAIELNVLVYYTPNSGEIPDGGPYLMVNRPCGDCTAYGSIEVPDFWID